MSIYDERRKALGLSPMGGATQSSGSVQSSGSAYDTRRAELAKKLSSPSVPSVPAPVIAPQQEEKSFFQRMAEYDPQGKFLPGNLDNTGFGQFLKRMNASQNEVRLGTPQEKPDAPLSLAADLIGGALGFVGGGSGNIGATSFNIGSKAVEKLPILAKAPKAVGTAAGLAGGSVAYDATRGVLNGEPITAKDIGIAAAQNAALGLLPYGIGKGLSATKELRLAPKVKARELAKDAQMQAAVNPLADIQSAYRTPSLRDAQQRELEQAFSGSQKPLATQFNPLKAENPSQYFGKTSQGDLESAFGRPLKNFKVSKDTQNAIDEISAQMENQLKGIETMIKQADEQTSVGTIRKEILDRGGIRQSNDGIFEEKRVIPNWIRNDKTGMPLDQMADELGMDSNELLAAISDSAYKPRDYASEAYRVAHNDPEYQALSNTLDVLKGELPGKRTLNATPSLKPRELTPKQTAPEPLFLQRELPTQPNPLTWTNKDAILPAGPAPIRSITEQNLGQLPGANLPPAGQRLVQSLNGEKAGNRVADARIEPPEPLTIQSGTIMRQPLAAKTGESLPVANLPEPQSKIIIGKSSKEPFSFKNAWNKFYTGVVDKQHPIMGLEKTTGTDIGKLASNTRNTSGIVDYNILKGLVDKNGNRVGDSLKEVVETIPKGKEEDFWTYMSQRHNIDRAREGKPVQANYTPEMSKGAVRQIEQSHPEYKAIGDNITSWIDKFMKTWGVDTGIVNKDIYDELRQTYKSYFPTQRDFSTLEKAIPDNVSQKFVDQRTPIRKATGSERDIIDPTENIMNLVNRTIRAAKFNEVGQTLLGEIRKDPTKLSQFAEVIPTKEGMFSNLDNVVTVLENGKPVYLKINDKALLDAMEGLPKNVNNIPYLTATTNMVKGLITQKNPFFAVRNIFRDIPTAYAYGSESNPVKFTGGLIGAGKDILTNSPRLQRYQAVGGGGANFFNSSETPQAAAELLGKKTPVIQKVVHPIKTLGESKFVKAIEKFNNLTETAPRLAEFNRVLDKTGDVTKALSAANDVTVNFSRGGNAIKTLDKAGGMYINASVQGLDKFFRGFKNPKTAVATLAKSGIGITTPTIAVYLMNKDNPYYSGGVDSNGNPIAGLDNRTKDTYYNIPNYLGPIDDRGYPETFIKLPKSRELGVLFGSLFERIGRSIQGQQDSFKGFGKSVATNFAPANPLESSMITPIIDLKANKDFANRAIVPQGMLMDKRSPYLQYDDKTTSIAKAIGEISSKADPSGKGLSPKQLDYLVRSYSGVIGQFGIPLAVPGGNPLKAIQTQFTSDPVFSNQATGDFYDKLDKLSATAIDKNILEKIPSKKLTPEEDIKNSMQGISSAISRGTKQINKIQASSNPNKDDQIRSVKKQILELMASANAANDPRAMQLVEDRANRIFKK